MKKIKGMFQKKRSCLEIVLYVLAVVFIFGFIYTFIDACVYINSLISQEQIVFGSSIGKIMKYIMAESGNFFFFGISFAIYARIISYMKQDKITVPQTTLAGEEGSEQ